MLESITKRFKEDMFRVDKLHDLLKTDSRKFDKIGIDRWSMW